MQYSLVFFPIFLIIILDLFYYATQEEQICLYESINDVDDLLKTHDVDTSGLYPGSWIKFIQIPIILSTSATFIAFFVLHVLGKEKHLTIQLLPGMLACYRVGVAIFQLIAIKDRYAALNGILKKLVQRNHDTGCVICTQLGLNRRTKLLSRNMCYKHTIL